MAGPLPCDNHPDRLAASLLTDLETGNTLTLCRDCLVYFAEMLCGILPPATDQVPEPVEGAQEVADLVPVAPGPDAEPKSGPEDEEDDAAERTYPPPTPQETKTPSE